MKGGTIEKVLKLKNVRSCDGIENGLGSLWTNVSQFCGVWILEGNQIVKKVNVGKSTE